MNELRQTADPSCLLDCIMKWAPVVILSFLMHPVHIYSINQSPIVAYIRTEYCIPIVIELSISENYYFLISRIILILFACKAE